MVGPNLVYPFAFIGKGVFLLMTFDRRTGTIFIQSYFVSGLNCTRNKKIIKISSHHLDLNHLMK